MEIDKSTVDIGKRVDQYVKLRDRIKEIKDAHSKELAPYVEALENLNNILLGHLNAVGTDSATIKGVGTVYKTTKASATTADAAALREYVQTHNAWELVDVKPNAPAVKDYIITNRTTPPGVNFSQTYVVGVRRG
jgi:hypothetical protein